MVGASQKQDVDSAVGGHSLDRQSSLGEIENGYATYPYVPRYWAEMPLEISVEVLGSICGKYRKYSQ